MYGFSNTLSIMKDMLKLEHAFFSESSDKVFGGNARLNGTSCVPKKIWVGWSFGSSCCNTNTFPFQGHCPAGSTMDPSFVAVARAPTLSYCWRAHGHFSAEAPPRGSFFLHSPEVPGDFLDGGRGGVE
jgi:hypothetical protein